jgi:hypothetical protein
MVAPVHTLRQPFWNDFPAIRAELTCVFGIDQYDTTTSFFRFVRGVLYKLIPRRINDAFGKVVIFHHSLHVQIFKSNESVAIDQFSRHFVRVVPALIRDMLMQSRQFSDGFATTNRPLLLA